MAEPESEQKAKHEAEMNELINMIHLMHAQVEMKDREINQTLSQNIEIE